MGLLFFANFLVFRGVKWQTSKNLRCKILYFKFTAQQTTSLEVTPTMEPDQPQSTPTPSSLRWQILRRALLRRPSNSGKLMYAFIRLKSYIFYTRQSHLLSSWNILEIFCWQTKNSQIIQVRKLVWTKYRGEQKVDSIWYRAMWWMTAAKIRNLCLGEMFVSTTHCHFLMLLSFVYGELGMVTHW